jgi:hypothetical protein
LQDSESSAKPEKKEEASVPKDIAGEIDLFVNQIDGLAETLPLAELSIQEAHNSSK